MLDQRKFEDTASSLKDKFNELEEQVRGMKKKLRDEAMVTLNGCFKEFFEAVPEIKAITWTQYTPYWNDGDTCTFHVGDIWFVPAALYEDWGGGYAEEYAISLWGDGDPAGYFEDSVAESIAPLERRMEIKKICKMMQKVLESLSSDSYEYLWGDHCCVCVTALGITTDEHEHD